MYTLLLKFLNNFKIQILDFKYLSTIVFTVLFANAAFAQNIGDYRTRNDGDWNSNSRWQTYNGTSWVDLNPYVSPPNGVTIYFRSGHNIRLNIFNYTLNNNTLIFEGSSDLRINEDMGTFTLNNCLVQYIGSRAQPIFHQNGSTNILFNSGSILDITTSSNPTIPRATWHNESILKLRNNTSSALSYNGLNQTFGIVEFNRPNLTSNQTINFGNIQNRLEVISTGSGTLAPTNSDLFFDGDIVVDGGFFSAKSNGNNNDAFQSVRNLVVNSGTFRLHNNTNEPTVFSIRNDFTFNGGNIAFCGSSPNESSYLDVGRNITLNSNNFTNPCNGADSGIYFVGNGISDFTSTVALDSTINQRFYYQQSSGLQGINLFFNGLSPQATFTGIANQDPFGPYVPIEYNSGIVKNVTINNPTEVSVTSNFVVNNNLYLNSGNLNNSTNNINVANNCNVHRTGGSVSALLGGNTIYHVIYPSHSSFLITGNEIPDATNRLNNLTIANTHGIKANKSFQVNGVLNLNVANPTQVNGLLDMVIDYGNYATQYSVNSTDDFNNLNSHILTLGTDATITGNADVTGKIRRSGFTSETPYAFGNQNTLLTFSSISGSALPTSITVIATKGDKGLHVDKDGDDSYRGDANQPNIKAAVKRLYQVLRTGGDAATRMTIRLAYDSSELNGNDTNNLVLWDHHLPYDGVSPHEHGQTNRTSNYVELTNHGLFYLAQENDITNTKYWMISEKETTDVIWIGAVAGGSWDILSNWSDGKPRNNTDKIVIPSSSTYQHKLIITDNKQIGVLEVKPGGQITLNANKTLTISGGPAANGGAGSWNNQGTFIAGNNSKVLFTYSGATLSGKGDFHHLEVANGADLLVSGEADIKIKGDLILNGEMDAQTNNNTINFNGSNQNIPVPTSGDKTGYHNLKIEQTTGNASLTGNTRIGGTLTLTNGNLNIGSNTLSLYGNYFAGDLSLLNVEQTSSLELRNTEGGTFTFPNFSNITNLTLAAPNAIFNPNQSATLHGNLSIINSQLNLNDKTFNRNTVGGNLSIGENSYLKIGGTNGLPQNYLVHSIHETSTVEYAGSNQEITLPSTAQKYGYLILSEEGTKRFPEAVSRIDVEQTLTVANNANFLVEEDKNLVVKNQFINNSGTVLFKNNSSLLQLDNVTNIGNISYQRTTRGLKHLDFVYWGSMVNNRALKDIWMTNAGGTFYQFNSSSNAWTQVSGNTIMQPGTGYIARARYNSNGWAPTNVPVPIGGHQYTANFISIPINGNVPVSITPSNFNLLANPYPSALDLEKFVKQGSENINDAPFFPSVFIWTQTNPIQNNSYRGDDYAVYNLALNEGTSAGTYTPTKFLNAGQAFFIQAKENSGTSASFNNTQRVIEENSNFTKPGNPKNNTIPTNPLDKYRLNLKNSLNDYKQISIVHASFATNNFDSNLESPAFNGNTNMNFFSLIGTSRIAIQARETMTTTDEFPIGYQANTAGNYTIELSNKNGVFENHPIYLVDLLTNQVHNLQSGAYTFNTASGTHNSRFRIKYFDETLGNNTIELQNLIAYTNQQTLFVKTAGEILDNIEVYDMQGRIIQTFTNIQSNQFEKPLNLPTQIIILKIKTTEGKTATRKLGI